MDWWPGMDCLARHRLLAGHGLVARHGLLPRHRLLAGHGLVAGHVLLARHGLRGRRALTEQGRLAGHRLLVGHPRLARRGRRCGHRPTGQVRLRLGDRGGLLGGRRSRAQRIRHRAWPAGRRLGRVPGRAAAGRHRLAVAGLAPRQWRGLHRVRGRLRGPLVLSHHRRGVDGRRGRMRARGQGLLGERADDRPVPVSQGAASRHGQLVRLIRAQRPGPGDEFRVGAQVPFADLDDVVAFLAQAAGNGPVAAYRDVHDEHPDAEILHVGDDLGQILLGTDQQRVADRVVARQRGQVAADLALHPFAATRPSAGPAAASARADRPACRVPGPGGPPR